MPSALFVSLTQTLHNLKSHLIVVGKDYGDYTPAEHSQALGFRVLASAHLEDYVEGRCRQIARLGVERFKRGQPSRTGRCLLTWHTVRKGYPIPLERSEYVVDNQIDKALESYEGVVANKHGVSGIKLRELVLPLGLREADLDERLFDTLQNLAGARGAAAHVKVNRAKQMVEPEQEWDTVQVVLPFLEGLDGVLDRVVTS